ncbi:sarcosine oxidase subunit gamma [Planktotalea sp.]|uniref:sarcosine oxidase subunit gamma n=1 Tax=Planktotalea sp. TaxID=2029877 RepID=UPI00329751B1
MHSLTAITPLGGTSARVDTIGDLTLTENIDLALASVHARLCHEEACKEKLNAQLNAAVPEVGKAVFADPLSAFWTGPDQWMLSAPFESHETIALDLAPVFAGIGSVTEQTDAWASFDLTGQSVEAAMELLCGINMRSFGPADVQRTSIHHLGCFVLHLEAAQGLRIMGPRASAGSVHHAIITAMRSIA